MGVSRSGIDSLTEGVKNQVKGITVRWMSRFVRVTHSVDGLALFRRVTEEFLCQWGTVDETWIHH